MEKPLSTWLSIPETAEYLGVGIRAVHTLIHEGHLTVRKVPGSYRRVLRTEVEALAEKTTTPAFAS
jgi:excisionase family DNA binding protein